tara:strand:- start:28 stop:450 length:423 start_codon:yes stop_codon:yes gene_type:complete
MVVVHGDAGSSDAGTISWIQDPASKVSYHYLVGRDGRAYQFVEESDKAWHAGASEWEGFINVNEISIGVSFANDGAEQFRDIQYQMGGKLISQICKRHNIPAHRIRGHYEVSPGRKTDPWSHFNWSRMLQWYALHSGDKL